MTDETDYFRIADHSDVILNFRLITVYAAWRPESLYPRFARGML